MLWWLLQNALGATFLAAGAALLSRALRLSPSARHALWLVVIAKLLAPPLLVWPCPWETPVAATSSAAEVAPAAAGIPTLTLLAGLWLAGAATMAAFQAVRLVDLYVRLRGAKKPPQWLRDDAARLAEGLGVTLPRIVVASSIGSPLLVGGIRPRLVVPETLLGRLDLPAWRSVLIHELAHLKRRDHWIGWVELIAACVWWWNPVFWHARRRLRENAEFACDAWVVRMLPEGRRGYAESLITVIDTLAWKPATVAAIGMAAGGKRIFERRLEMILREAVPHRMSPLATTAALLIALMALPGLSHPTALAVETTQPAPVVAVAVAQPEPAAPPVTVSASTPIPVAPAPAKTVETPKPSKPAAVKPKQQRAKRHTPMAVAQDPMLKKAEGAATTPAPSKRNEETQYALADASKSIEPSPKATSLQEALPPRVDLSIPKTEETSDFLKKVEVHGQIRIRYSHYSKH